MEERLAGRGVVGLIGWRHQPARPSAVTVVLAAIPLAAAIAGALALQALPAAFIPASRPMSAAELERRLLLRYPKLRDAEDAVIACPDRPLDPGGESRCWILARVGLQRSVVVRVSERGNAVHVED
jgi:hypothetical protein